MVPYLGVLEVPSVCSLRRVRKHGYQLPLWGTAQGVEDGINAQNVERIGVRMQLILLKLHEMIESMQHTNSRRQLVDELEDNHRTLERSATARTTAQPLRADALRSTDTE